RLSGPLDGPMLRGLGAFDLAGELVLEPVHAAVLVRLRLELRPGLAMPVLRFAPGGARPFQGRLGLRERTLGGFTRRADVGLPAQGVLVLHGERAELLLPLEDARSA